jgi:predicted nucleic acid-binding protein
VLTIARRKWLLLREPTDGKLVEQLGLRLDPGEAEALVVALELRADRVLIDERRARRVALDLNLQPLGLLGILAEAKQRGLLQECKPVLDDMIHAAGFWIGEPLYVQFLAVVGESR